MFYTPEICKAAWTKEKESSPIGDSYSKIKAWGQFWDYLSSSYSDGGEREYVHEIVELLRADGALGQDFEVLDIGCGPGTFSLPFLNAGAAHVDCVDSSPGMLAQLKKQTALARMEDKVGIFPCTWDDFDNGKKYDLVFSSLSPAISEYDELMCMEKFSKKGCCLVTFAHGSHYHIRGKLWEAICGKSVKSEIFDVIYPFNLLYSLGRHPNMKTFHSQRLSRLPLEQVYQDNLEYFNIFGYNGAEVEGTIRGCLEKIAVDGYCHEDASSHISAIWWNTQG